MSTIDWAAAHARVAAAARRLAPEPAPAEVARQLAARAAALARVPAPAADADLEVLLFRLGGETYALPTASVVTVCPYAAPMPVPGTPPFYAGAAMLDGEVYAVLDLRSLLDLPLARLAEPAAFIYVAAAGRAAALLAEEVDGVHCLRAADLDQAPAGLPAPARSYLAGVTPARVAVLDAARLLADPRLVIDHPALASESL